LQQSFTFSKNFGDHRQLLQRNINIPNHNHHDLLIVKRESSSTGFGGYAWASVKMTNNLPHETYTAVFETFSAIITSPVSITSLSNETLITEVLEHDGYQMITFSHDYQTTHSKVFIYFKTNGQPRRINFQIRHYGSNYDNPGLNFLFYSRVLAGRVGYAFDHRLFDVDDIQMKDQILYFEDHNLNENKIKGLAPPSEEGDRVKKETER